MRYLIHFSYDGTNFNGFQKQPGCRCVESELEKALYDINDHKKTKVVGSGRTDRGVHALDQCVSFRLDVSLSNEGLRKALNSLVEPYIYVKEVIEVDKDFHARFNVNKKQYLYKINLGEFNPLFSDYVYQSKYKLDIEKMKEVSKLYIGVHDFTNFVSGERNNNECIIYNISFDIKDKILEIRFEGKSFYRYMVRNLVGMMIEVGRGKNDITKVKEMLDNNTTMFGFTAPACGLYLEKIEY